MASNFADVLMWLDDMKILDSLIPFVLIFTLVFAVLQKTQVLGIGKKNFNVVVALAIALMVVIPHVMDRYPEGQDPITIMNTAIPNVSILMVAILAALLLVGIMGIQFMGGAITGFVALISFFAIFYIFGAAAGWFGGAHFPWFLRFLDDEATRSMLIVILVFGIIVWFITKDDANAEGSMGWLGGAGKVLSEAFQKK